MKSVGTPFAAAGGSHTSGFVPDPGSGGGTTRFLREDSSWQEIIHGTTAANPALLDELLEYNKAAGANRLITVDKLLGSQRFSPGGRLTLTSGLPVPVSVASSTVVYYTPYVHDGVWIFDGSRWLYRQLPEIALDIGGLSLGASTLYDVLMYSGDSVPTSTNTTTDVLTFTTPPWQTGAVVYADTTAGGLTAGTPYWYRVVSSTTGTLHTTLAGALANTGKVDLTASITATLTTTTLYPLIWNNSGGGTSARISGYAMLLQDGRYSQENAKYFLYLGTIRCTTTGTTMDTPQRRLVFNAFNRVPRNLFYEDSTASWTWSSNSWRIANNPNGGLNFVDHVVGLPDVTVDLSLHATDNSTVFGAHYVGIAFNGAGTPTVYQFAAQEAGGYNAFHLRYTFQQAIGYHYYYWMEFGVGAGTTTWYGTGTSANGFRGFIVM